MARKEKLYTVHTVLYHSDDPKLAYSGPTGDGSFTQRFSRLSDAEAFADGRDYYGKPASVMTDKDVPYRLASRWGVA